MTAPDPEEQDWPSAIAGALVLALVFSLIAAAITMRIGPPGQVWIPALVCGAIVGTGTAGFMLYLYYWQQVTARDIWRGIADLLNVFWRW